MPASNINAFYTTSLRLHPNENMINTPKSKLHTVKELTLKRTSRLPQDDRKGVKKLEYFNNIHPSVGVFVPRLSITEVFEVNKLSDPLTPAIKTYQLRLYR